MIKDYLIKQSNNKYHLNIKLTPNAKFNKIDGVFIDENKIEYLKVFTTAIPENNKANQYLIKMISKELTVPKSQINLIKGLKSRLKLLEIEL